MVGNPEFMQREGRGTRPTPEEGELILSGTWRLRGAVRMGENLLGTERCKTGMGCFKGW